MLPDERERLAAILREPDPERARALLIQEVELRINEHLVLYGWETERPLRVLRNDDVH